MERVSAYRRGFAEAGLNLLSVDDLSERVQLNWELSYRAALAALAQSLTPAQLVRVAAGALKYGPGAVRLLKQQFSAVVLAKAAAAAGILRYVSFLAEAPEWQSSQ